MLKLLILTLICHTLGFTAIPQDITPSDIVNIETIHFYEDGISIEFNEDYCIRKDLDYRGYWLERGNIEKDGKI